MTTMTMPRILDADPVPIDAGMPPIVVSSEATARWMSILLDMIPPSGGYVVQLALTNGEFRDVFLADVVRDDTDGFPVIRTIGIDRDGMPTGLRLAYRCDEILHIHIY